jgi:hypothetical protein
MRSFYYQRGRRAAAAIVMAFFAIAGGRVWRDEGGFFVLAFALAMTVGAAKAALDAMNRKPALKFDGFSVWIRRTWGGVEEVSWNDVHDINLKSYTVRYMGIIPVRRHMYIVIACEGGTFGARRLRVSTTAMGMSAAQSATIVAALKQAQLDAVGEVGVAMAGAGSRGWGVDMGHKSRDPDFDADRAMARYLASKEGDERESPPVRAAARPLMPQRPSFGRRVG